MFLIRFIKQLYLTNRLFLALSISVGVFVMAFIYPSLFIVGQLSVVVIFSLCLVDIMILFSGPAKVQAKREMNDQFSLGDDNPIKITLYNKLHFPLSLRVIDELPYQFQKRDFEMELKLAGKSEETLVYHLRPTKRGAYQFNDLNVYSRSFLGFVQRRVAHNLSKEIKVYPSVMQMKKYELQLFTSTNHMHGMKKIRRFGNNQEFEQIKNYVQGDDFRKINWKATSRRGELMVNQYQDERSQNIYSIIDKSRSMKMPFNGMTLLDHAINTTLVISNVALRKQDKAGLLTFSDKLGVHVKSEKQGGQLAKIMEQLYRQKTFFKEANFEMLYYGIRQHIKGRSLIFLYTNFESHYAMQRAMPLLRKINKNHLLCVVFFENTELLEATENRAENIEDIYFQTFADKFILEKRIIAKDLEQYGINTILTTPENLSIDTINKYLELKARGLI